MPIGNGVRPGLIDAEQWHPYKIWACDEWECPGCGAVILYGFGFDPVAEQHQKDFAEIAERTKAREREINDC